MARDDLPESHIRTILEVATGLETTPFGRQILAHMEIERFETATSESYDEARSFVAEYAREFSLAELAR